MDYSEINDPTTPFVDATFLDGPPDDMDLVRPGYVGSRIRDLNIKTSKDNLKAQSSTYVTDVREDVTVCSPACQRTRLEVTASPPVGHSYPGLRVYDDHSDDNGVAWEVAATSSHRFNVRPSLRVSRSSNAVALQSPARGPNRFRNLPTSNESVVNRVGDARPTFKSPMRSQANLRASLPPFQTVHEVLDSSNNEQQDVLDMFDTYGVSRPDSWLSGERERQQASGMKTVQVCHSCGGYLHTRARCARCGHEFCFKCRTELVSGLCSNLEAGRERGKDEQASNQETLRRGVTHSRSVANLSEPVLDRDRAMHRLSHSKSSDAVSYYHRESRLSHAEAERQAHRHHRHERRQRLEKSHSEMVSPEQYYGCPTCHASGDRARHSICCIARQSQPSRQLVGRDNTGDEATYKSCSKDSFESAHTKLEADKQAVLAASLSSGYTTAEPFSVQKPEREILSEERATAPSSHSHTHRIRHDKDRQPSSRQRMPGPANSTTAQAMEQDTFWICSEGPGTSQRKTVPQSVESGHQDTPRLTLEGVELESELSRSSTSAPGKTAWKTPATSRLSSPSGDEDDMPKPRQDFKYVEQTRNTREQQPRVLPRRERGSPVRREDNPTPETAKRSGREALGPRDSVKVTSAGKNPQQAVESSDPSTWKQQLRKLNDTPALRDGSPRKDYTVSSPDIQRHLRQSPAANIHEEASPSPPTRHKTESGKRSATENRQSGTTRRLSNRYQAEDAVEESKVPSDTPGGDSEMPISHHICEWRTRYLGLSCAFDKLKIELDGALEQQESQRLADEESQRHMPSDDGIEGLTIIVHRRFREDLILNTDLREE